jgi:hypothetical protein
MNLKRMKRKARGDGLIVLLIAVFTLFAMIALGVHASNRPCEEVGETFGSSPVSSWQRAPMCKNNRLD